MDPLDLTGMTVMLTGGHGAIGHAVVQALTGRGARVAVNDVIPEDDRRLVAEDRAASASYYRADATRPDEVDLLFDRVIDTMDMPDVVCCHAGITGAYPIEEYPVEKFDALMDVNLRSAFLVARAAARRWIERGRPGHLIFTTSWVQDVPWPEITPYAASKAGMRALMRGFARELAPRGIRANAVAPGMVAAGMTQRHWDADAVYRHRAERAIPLGYLQPLESVAHAFLFLCSPMASYMTGSVLLVDGGASLYPMD